MAEDKKIDLTKNIILQDETHLLLDHNYDGIQELNHPLPRWWVWLFYLCIAFSVVYAGYYLVGPGPTLQDELNVALKAIEAKKEPRSTGAEETDETFIAWLKDDSHVQAGKQVFTSKCAACHGVQGQGIIGPNLTDDYWLHGEGKLKALAEVVRGGVLDKGMPPWKQILTPDEVKSAIAYIASLHGSHPQGAKAAQGDKFDWKLQ